MPSFPLRSATEEEGQFALFAKMTAIDYNTEGLTTNDQKISTSASSIQEIRITFAMADASGVTEAGLKAALTEKIGATYVEIEDMSGRQSTPSKPLYWRSLSGLYRGNSWTWADRVIGGCGQAFSAIIVSPEFVKKTSLARHRLVNSALKAEIAAIHAWTPKCYTPEQWAEQSPGTVAPGKATTGEVVTGTTA